MIKRSLSSFFFNFLVYLCTYLFIYLFVCLFIYFLRGGIDMGETLPVCREHVHTGRPHTRKDNSIFKKPDVMFFQ